MLTEWEEIICEKLQIPFCYCIHNKDVDADGNPRKEHVHIMIAFNNTTTKKNALETFRTLNAEGKNAINTCESVRGVRLMYNYMIHDTDDARKKNKYQYDPSERITGNNFDIGNYEQISLEDEDEIFDDIIDVINAVGINNINWLYREIRKMNDKAYKRVFKKYSHVFVDMCKAQNFENSFK